MIGFLDFLLPSVYIFLPAFVGFTLLWFRSLSRVGVYVTAAVTVLFQLVLSGWLVLGFDLQAGGYQFVVKQEWIPFFNINYAVGFDALALIFCLLTVIVFGIGFFVGYRTESGFERIKTACMLISLTGLLGAFASFDAFLFYVFWELSIIPLFFVMNLSENAKRRFSLRFIIYSLVASFAIFAGFVFISLSHEAVTGRVSFDMTEWIAQGEGIIRYPYVVFALLFFGFAVKVPLVPFHSWMPMTYVESPFALTLLLSGIFSKLGIYGFIRFLLPIFGPTIQSLSFELMLLVLLGTLYAAMIAMYTKTPKTILAYSSASHLGLLVFGLLSLSSDSIRGALFQTVSHGLAAAGLFGALALLCVRYESKDGSELSGLWDKMPVCSFFMIAISVVSIGFPGTIAFIGEFKILAGAFAVDPLLTAAATLTTVFSAIYMLNMLRRMVFGTAGSAVPSESADFSYAERLIFGCLVFVLLLFGVVPGILNVLVDAAFYSFIHPILPIGYDSFRFAAL